MERPEAVISAVELTDNIAT